VQTPEPKNSLIYIYKIALVASIGGFLFGYDLVIISGAILFIETHFELTASLKGFVVSSAILGALIGPLAGLWFTDRIGRRKTMMASAAFFAISTIGCALAVTVWDLCFWRFLGGIGIGLAMMSSPIYIAELSPAHLRGRLVNVNQLSNVIGINLAVIVSYFLSFDGQWRWMFASQGVPVFLLILGLVSIPESPRWLAEKGRLEEAMKILVRINGQVAAALEMDEIKAQLREESGRLKELFAPGIFRALVIAVILMILSQVNGVNMILLYAPSILTEAGISIGSNAILSSIPIYIFIFICTIVAFPLIKKFSRKALLISSILVMALGHVVMAVVLQFGFPPMTMLIPMLIGTGAFTLGLAPLSWVIVTEIFPNRNRGMAMAIVCFFLYTSSFLITQAFPMLTDWFNVNFHSTVGVYWLFAVVCLSGALFSWRMIPETKGLSLEEIGAFWDRKLTEQ
jgi:sugar porter (SP) family MFS transporter